MSSGKTTIPFLIFLTGILLVLLSVFRGEADVALILFIPVISGGGLFISIGILLIFLSFFLFFIIPFFGTYRRSEKKETTYQIEEKTKTGGVIFIGPIPIIFGESESTAKKMMYLGLVIGLILAAGYAMYVFS